MSSKQGSQLAGRIIDLYHSLNWPTPLVECSELSGVAKSNRSCIYYIAGSLDDIAMQVNVAPYYSACVYALRYRLFSGWRRFDPYSSKQVWKYEIERLKGWLGRDFFSDAVGRRLYRSRHPECSNYSWTRIRKEGPNRWIGDK